MQIPYTSTAHPETGVYNAKLGIWLFLASEVMLFGALFTSYILLRVGAPVWPHGSSILSVPRNGEHNYFDKFECYNGNVWASLMMNDFKKYKMYMGLTILAL